jgi:hypothetical protein
MPPAVHHTRPFWLGALASAALLIPLAILAVALTGGGDEESPGVAATPETEASEFEREIRERDTRQAEELTRDMARMLVELNPAVRGLAETVPPTGKQFGPMADPDAVDGWSRTAQDAAEYFEDPPSGETEYNVARIGFAAAVDGLVGAIETYRLALADSGDRRLLLERVRAQRDLAVQAWSAGGIELDALNHKHGFGHHHVYLKAGGLRNRAPNG